MPRTPRAQAQSDIYHVVSRGVGRQIIFEDDADRRFYLQTLAMELSSRDGSLLAWCLMDNHVHLLISVPFDELSRLMQTAGSCYASRFNARHNRVGHLFQDRFWSEPVDTDAYLLTVVRYIHQNPVKAGLASSCGDYPWSSFHVYASSMDDEITNCDVVFSLFDSEKDFIDFHDCYDEIDALREHGHRQRLSTEEAVRIGREALPGVLVEEVARLPRPRRNAALRDLRTAGLSIRQIERLTGVSRGIVERAVKM